ncbi:MAG: c-type cytochrome [Myxococcota bacterium]
MSSQNTTSDDTTTVSSESTQDMPADMHELHDPILREKARPRDGFQPIPLTLIFAFFALLMWGGYYLGEYSGDWRADIYEPGGELALAAAGSGEQDQEVDLMALGKRTYANCAACHQNNGKGVPGNFPPLDGSTWVTGSKQRLTRILLHGLEGPIEVKGESYSGAMPGWKQLSDEELAGVMTYVRASWSNEAAEVSPELVAEIRKETEGRSRTYKASDLEEFVTEP